MSKGFAVAMRAKLEVLLEVVVVNDGDSVEILAVCQS
jgi:hypothetical protein